MAVPSTTRPIAPSAEATEGHLPPRERARAGSTTVVACLALSLLAVAPGIAGRLGFETQALGPMGAVLRQLWANLDDIKFGSGLRFWLGVSGTAMMGVLLLYPLRKRLSARPWFGRISRWFKAHLVLGFLGPILILYHANFGHGGFNANIALWSMLTIMASGIVGQFIYAEISARRHADKDRAETHLIAIRSTLNAFSATTPSLAAIVQDLDTFNSSHLQAPKTLLQSLRTRVAIHAERKRLTHLTLDTFNQALHERHLAAPVENHLRSNLQNSVHAYFSLAQRATNRAVREQLWARWRLFHLPLFIIMTAAVVLHVIAVWGLDQDNNQSLEVPSIEASSSKSRADRAPSIIQIKRTSIQIGSQKLAIEPQHPVRPHLATTQPTDTLSDQPNAEGTQPSLQNPLPPTEPRLLTAPQRVTSPTVRKPEPRPQALAQAIPAPAPSPEIRSEPQHPSALQKTETSAAVSELQRRIDESPPMGLGGAKPRTLVEQITLLKSKQKAGQFSHSAAETSFALTGEHTKVECSSCHTKPLRETAQNAPRACISCHKQDDVHRGRRPDCASCHTTNRWSEIIRRR